MRTLILFFLISSFHSIFTKHENNQIANDIINKIVEKHNSKNSISYSISFKSKSLFNIDTTKINGTCMLIRMANDSLCNGYILCKTDKNYEFYYDLKDVYYFDHYKKNVLIKKPNKDLRGNTYSNLIETFFLKSEKLVDYIKDTTNRISITEETTDNTKLYHLIIKSADTEELSEIERNIWVDNANFIITKITFKVKFNNDYQYQEWNLNDICFDNVSIEKIKNHTDSLFKEYKLISFSENKAKQSQLLEKSITAPSFKGIYFNSEDKFNFDELKNELVLLDFWYVSCYPCIKLIPFLDDIYKEFGNKGLKVIGVNSNDKNNPKKISNFLKNNKLSYPIVLTDKSTDSIYHIQGYPTCYLIKDGKIIYSESGFSLSVVDTLKQVIKSEIDKK